MNARPVTLRLNLGGEGEEPDCINRQPPWVDLAHHIARTMLDRVEKAYPHWPRDVSVSVFDTAECKTLDEIHQFLGRKVKTVHTPILVGRRGDKRLTRIGLSSVERALHDLGLLPAFGSARSEERRVGKEC